MAQSQTSKPLDPFQGTSILSLHPRTFPDSKVSLKSNDLDSIHQYMTSLVLQNPDKHFEEAKLVIDGSSELLNTKEVSEPNMKENENPQKNRPALARKRAKFSMKPDTRQPSTVVEPTFQMDQLHDPEDFFAAYEKFENTVKELKRQRGEEPDELKIPTTARQRRPELQRRKISYQHHVYSSQPENDALSSQEAPKNTIESQTIHDSQYKLVNHNCQTKEKEIDGSVTKVVDRDGKLLDNLLSSDIRNLGDNEAMSYLRDCLKIKSFSVGSLQLSDFQDISTVNLFPSVNLIKDQNISGNLNKNTLGKQKKLPDKPSTPLSSPTPSKSPFSAISTFGKLLSKSLGVKSVDPFSSHDLDMFPTTNTSEVISGPATHVRKDKEFSFSTSTDNISEPLVSTEDTEKCRNVDDMDEGIHVNAEGMVEKPASPTDPNLYNITDNFHSEQDTGENIEDATVKVMPSSQPEENVEITTIEESGSNRFRSDDSSFNVSDASLPVQNSDVVPEQQNEERPAISMNNRKKTRARKIDRKKKRYSLAGGGSSWTTGVRRSSRIKRKPLEYWKGERLLYARVHNSLPTVVGVKYISSTDSNRDPGFKVESFVADKYKDLVDLVSLH